MNPKDPQAELNTAIYDRALKFANDCGSEALEGRDFAKLKALYIDFATDVEALLQAREQQIYKAIMGDPPYMTPDGKRSEKEMLIAAAQNKVLAEILGELPEKYDGGVTFKKPDEKQILEDGKTIGRNEVIDHVVKTIEHYREGLHE